MMVPPPDRHFSVQSNQRGDFSYFHQFEHEILSAWLPLRCCWMLGRNWNWSSFSMTFEHRASDGPGRGRRRRRSSLFDGLGRQRKLRTLMFAALLRAMCVSSRPDKPQLDAVGQSWNCYRKSGFLMVLLLNCWGSMRDPGLEYERDDVWRRPWIVATMTTKTVNLPWWRWGYINMIAKIAVHRYRDCGLDAAKQGNRFSSCIYKWCYSLAVLSPVAYCYVFHQPRKSLLF